MSKLLIGKYEATIYPEGDGWTGAIDIGYDGTGRRQRIKRKGRTKTIVKDKLKDVVDNLDHGIKTGKDSENYTAGDAVQDWLAKGLRGREPKTVTTLTMDGLAPEFASSSLCRVHWILKRSIRQAQARDKVMRNVAELVSTPKGTEGRPSKAMTFDQATAMLEEAKQSRLHAYGGREPANRHPDRGSPRAAMDAHRRLARGTRGMAAGNRRRLRSREVRDLRLAISTRHRRHQDKEVPPHAGTANPGRHSTQRTPDRATQGAAGRRPALARARPGVHHPVGRTARRGQRPPLTTRHHQASQPRRELDAP
jgi:hypothetical protein